MGRSVRTTSHPEKDRSSTTITKSNSMCRHMRCMSGNNSMHSAPRSRVGERQSDHVAQEPLVGNNQYLVYGVTPVWLWPPLTRLKTLYGGRAKIAACKSHKIICVIFAHSIYVQIHNRFKCTLCRDCRSANLKLKRVETLCSPPQGVLYPSVSFLTKSRYLQYRQRRSGVSWCTCSERRHSEVRKIPKPSER